MKTTTTSNYEHVHPETGFFKRHGILQESFETRSHPLSRWKTILEVIIISLIIISMMLLVFNSGLKSANTSESILPGTFENFNIQNINGKVYMAWVPDKLSESDYYMILRSSDGQTFEPVGMKIKTQAEQNGVFQFKDMKPFDGNSFYKIYRIRLGGSAGYSQIKRISQDDHSFALTRIFSSNSEK